MEHFDLQTLRRCCHPNATEMDEIEIRIVDEVLLQYLILDLNVKQITYSLYKGGYISEEIYKNVQRVLEKETNQNGVKVKKRVLTYLENKMSFVALLWAMSTCGYQSFANMLLSALEKARCSTISSQMKKAPITRSRALHVLVKQLKYISDSKTFDNPVIFIRRLAMRFKDRFALETEPNNKRKMADRYFAVLAVELDNFSFMRNRYVSANSVAAEIRRVVPFTSNSVMNEALLNGRVAEVFALNGDITSAGSIIQDVVTTMLSTEACPESANLFYMQLNILLRNYERSPSEDKKKHYIEMGYNGLRLLRVLDEDMMAYWKVSFMLRIIFCALDLSISGRPICLQSHSDTMETSQYLLSEVTDVIDGYGLRKMMCYNLAMGRMLHMKGFVSKAVKYLKKAKEQAKQGGFVEFKNIDEYERSLFGEKKIMT